jgi:hypothetical protein
MKANFMASCRHLLDHCRVRLDNLAQDKKSGLHAQRAEQVQYVADVRFERGGSSIHAKTVVLVFEIHSQSDA